MSNSIVLVAIIGLLAIGLYATLISRNLIKIVIGLQILVKGTMLGMMAAGQLAGQAEVGESLAITIIVADTIVAVVGLALAVQVRRHFGTLDTRALSTLKR
jgi:NADH-quinone oxidoreductase subunit K